MNAFAKQIAEVRALDTEGKYTEHLNKIGVEYKFIFLRAHADFNKEMLREKLPDRLEMIKEELGYTNKPTPHLFEVPSNHLNGWLSTCRQCKAKKLTLRMFSNELCCENCGCLEPLDGVAFDSSELYACGDDHKVVKKRPIRVNNFKAYFNKHMRICEQHDCKLSSEQIQHTNYLFNSIEEYLPERISMPFVSYKILNEIVTDPEQRRIVTYFWRQVPQRSVSKHEENWKSMLRQFNAVVAETQLSSNK